MKSNLIKSAKAYIFSKNNIVYEASNEFIELTGYQSEEIIGKSIEDISLLLRNQIQKPLQDINEPYDLYIFRKDDFPVQVKIKSEELTGKGHKVYYFEKKIDSSLEYIIRNLESGHKDPKRAVAIFNQPDRILLKYNENYINTLKLMRIDINKIIGNYPRFPNNILQLLKQKKSLQVSELECTDLDGTVTYWDITSQIISTRRERSYSLISLYDVTERVKSRKRFDNERKKMELILDNMSDMVSILNKKGEYTYINKTGKKCLAPYHPEEKTITSEMNYHAFVLNDINGKKLAFEDTPDQRVLRGEAFNNYIVIATSHLPTGHYECDGIPSYDEEGNPDGGVIIYRDIKDNYKIEEYSAFKEYIKDISIYYAVLSPKDYKVEYINEFGFKRIQGRVGGIKSELDLIGRSFFDFYHTKDINLIPNLEKSIENNAVFTHKQKFVNLEEISYSKILFQPAYNKDNDVDKIIAIGIDITDEETAKEQIKKALATQEEMFINTSHELKTPLNVISSAAQLLETELQNDSIESIKDGIKTTNKVIMQNCYRLTKLINNILDISRIESGLYELNLVDYNLVDVIDDIVESVIAYVNTQGLEIIFDTELEDLIIAIDIDNFEKVLLNLISNAIKFSKPSGIIKINLAKKDNNIEISVEDQGIGIAAEDLDLIFEKFRQINTSLSRSSEGTGIGLPLVKSIMALHGGQIKVESSLGQGSKFTMQIPGSVVENKGIVGNAEIKATRDERIRFELSDIYH